MRDLVEQLKSIELIAEGSIDAKTAFTTSMRNLGVLVVAGGKITPAQAKMFAQGLVGGLGLSASMVAEGVAVFKETVAGAAGFAPEE